MSEQLARVTEETQDIPLQKGENDPIMPFPTNYLLTKDQEDELIQHAIKRKKDLESELGRDDGLHGILSESPTYEETFESSESLTRSFMGKRRIYDLMYRNKVAWRGRVLGGIYEKSNLTLPVSRRIARQMTARSNGYFFSTEPWFAVNPVGDSDKFVADKADKYAKIKMEDAKLKQEFEASVERAYIAGECILKTTFLEDDRIYKTNAEVLVDNTGADILGQDGDYITSDDLWVPELVEDPETGEPFETGAFVLKRDRATPRPAQMMYVQKQIMRRKVIYKGAKSDIVHYRDFLCPLSANSVEDADCLVHLYDMPVMELAEAWRQKQVVEGAEESQQSTAEAIDLIRAMADDTSEKKSAKNSVRPEMDDSGENRYTDTEGEPVAEIAEFYMRYDANGDGMMEDIVLLLDTKTERPLYYDYVANYTDDGKRPFTVIRINPVPGRWYGEGAMEMFESSQNIIDKSLNRWNFSQMGSGRVDFWNPEATVEGQGKPNLELNTGQTYTLRNGKTAEDALSTVPLHDVKYDEMQGIFELFIQSTLNESGVQHANDNHIAGMDSTKLATGIKNIEKSGQEMFSVYLGHLEPGITETLRKMISVMNGNMDANEVVSYLEDESSDLIQISASEIKDYEMDVRVLLSRYKAEQILESNARASELIKDYYAQPYIVQLQTQSHYIEMLKQMQIPYAEKTIQPVDVQQPSMQGATQNINGGLASNPKREVEPNL